MARFRSGIAWLALTFCSVLEVPPASAQELPNMPVLSAEEIALKDYPAVPGAPAIILYYAIDTNNLKSTETQSLRIKILRDEGKKYANVEIPYWDKTMRVEGIRARIVSPDGKASEFADQIYDRELVKAKKFGMSAKMFTLPNVQTGSVIEYTYTVHSKEGIPEFFRDPRNHLVLGAFSYPAAEWIIQRDLFARHVHCTLHGYKGGEIREHHELLPAGVAIRNAGDGTFELDVENVPAYEKEEYAPPEDRFKMQATLYYAVGFFVPAHYWTSVGERRAKQYDAFIGKSKAIDREAARLIASNDSDESKLRKIYERVQRIRAVSYESAKTDKERKQENLKENKSAEDVLVRGYAYGNEINLLFVALARAAKFDANPVLLTSRKNSFFLEDLPNETQLDAMVVGLPLKSKMMFLDPATRFCPFGLLPWDESDAGGLLVGGLNTRVGHTPASDSADAVTRRKADLKLTEDGRLEGKVEIQYFGVEALAWRLWAISQGEAARNKEHEERLRQSLVQGAAVKVVSVNGWEDSEAPLKITFEVEIPNYATQAGRRLVLPVGVFHGSATNPFFSVRRVQPIDLGYARENYEEVKVENPAGMSVESLPQPRRIDQGAGFYEFAPTIEGNTLRLTRTWRMSGYLLDQKQYLPLRGFYDRVLAGDAQQATLVPKPEAAAK